MEEPIRRELRGQSVPFEVTECAALPGDQVVYVASNPLTGIGCAGRESRDIAGHDARALNAAYRMGQAIAFQRVLERHGYSADEHDCASDSAYIAWLRDQIRRAWEASYTLPTGQPPCGGG